MNPSAPAHFSTLTEGRAHLKNLIDAAAEGRPASIRRDSSRSAVVDAERLRLLLADYLPSGAELVPEAGGWTIVLPGQPLAADGSTVDDALNDMVSVLRDYAVDWSQRLRLASNHAPNWALVQLIELSDDSQLRNWWVGQ